MDAHGTMVAAGGKGARRMRRYAVALLVAVVCWLGMQWLHEGGHVVAGLASGGALERVVLVPWGFSRTDMDVDPRPLVTAWGGPVLGATVPLVAFGLWRRRTLVRTFAAFCLLANGAYLFFGSLEPMADAAVLLRHGAPRWTLLAFGVVALAGAGALCGSAPGRAAFGRERVYTRGEIIVAGTVAVVLGLCGATLFGDV